MFVFLQLGLSCYSRRLLVVGSWNDSQAACKADGAHLWTINSHEEWNTIFVKTAHNLHLLLSGEESEFHGFFDPLLSTHFFIGLIRPNPRKLDELQVRAYSVINFILLCLNDIHVTHAMLSSLSVGC